LICLELDNPDPLFHLLVKLETIKLTGTIDLVTLKTLGFLFTITGITTAKTKSMEKTASTLKTMELFLELRMELMSTSVTPMSVKRATMLRSRLGRHTKLKKRIRQEPLKLLNWLKRRKRQLLQQKLLKKPKRRRRQLQLLNWPKRRRRQLPKLKNLLRSLTPRKWKLRPRKPRD
jgi:hypothetical protein